MVALLPIMGVVFATYLIIGLVMPVLPLHVQHRLGLDAFTVGIVSGAPFAAAVLARMVAGNFADRRGSKQGMLVGLSIAVIAGVCYELSLSFIDQPGISVAILILGRIVLGVGESFIITGALSWGLTLLGARNTGKVMSWVGTALYAAFAVGAPIGSALYGVAGFASIGIATMLIPLVALVLVARMRSVPPAAPQARAALGLVVAAVWEPGLGVALSGVGFGAITTFIVLLYAARGWTLAWTAFTLLSLAFMLGRIAFGHLPDRLGGARVALICIAIEVAGQMMIWLGGALPIVLLGIALTGLGYSLVYPSFGVEAIRRAPPEHRALAMGAYTVYLDASLGLTGPLLGLVAAGSGVDSVFLASTLIVISSLIIAVRLRMRIPRCVPAI